MVSACWAAANSRSTPGFSLSSPAGRSKSPAARTVTTVELVDISTLEFDPRNPRLHDIAAISASLIEHGQHRPAVVTRKDRMIRIGNGMVKAALALGWETINVDWIDDDELQAKRRAVADNVTPTGEFDDALLIDILEEIGTDIPGLDQSILNRMKAEALEQTADPQPDFPIVARPGESYSYVMVVSTTDVDRTWLETTFDLEKSRDYKAHNRTGMASTVTVDQFRDEILPALAMSLGWTPPEETED